MNQVYKYKLKNVDCAVCANRIETEISRNPDIKTISFDLVNSTIETDFRDISKLNNLIKRIEPGAELERINAPVIISEKEDNRKEIIRISMVVTLLLAAILFKFELRENFLPYLDIAFLILAYFISGWGVLKKAFLNITRGRVFDENFLMTVATLGAIMINEIPEAVTVMLFYNIGEYLQGIAVRRSRKSVKALIAVRPDYANIQRNGEIIKISPEEVKIDDTILIRAGEKIPLDGIVENGETYVDAFALTGESVPRKLIPGDEALSGMINKTGLISIKVTRSFADSSISKIIQLVENATRRKAETEKFISKFARYYTPVVVVLAMIIAFFPPIFITGEILSDWGYRALVMLVVSCPCALVISIPLGYFGGIGGASRKGILIKGSVFLDALTELKTVVFDKTGTLTKGVFNVTEILVAGSYSKEELLKYAAHAEFYSNHPIAQSIIDSYNGKINQAGINSYQEISGKGIIAVIEGKEIIAGSDALLHQENIKHEKCFIEGTVVHVAIDKEYVGYLLVSDELKEKASLTLHKLSEMGIKRIMLTGDSEKSAKAMAGRLHLDNYYSGLLPEDKVNYLEKIMKENPGKTAFVGDGINDAPVIARADIGFAMGGLGSDAAIEASDIVIMQDDPSKIVEAIQIAGTTRLIVWQNILFALGVKVLFIILGGLGIATMWEAVFGDMGVALIAILNSTRAFRTL